MRTERKFFDSDWGEVDASDAKFAVELVFDNSGRLLKSTIFDAVNS